jgi:hypothetical protein
MLGYSLAGLVVGLAVGATGTPAIRNTPRGCSAASRSTIAEAAS